MKHPTSEELDRRYVRERIGLGGAFGGGGGGGGSTGITEDPDTLSDTAWAKIMDAICEGEIFGLADPANPMTCVAFDGTPVQRGVSVAGPSHLTGWFIPDGGTGYMAGDVLTVIGGTSTVPVTFRVDTPGTGGSIQFGAGAHITNLTNGSYTVLPPNPVSFSGGSGSGAQMNISWSGGAGSAPTSMGGSNISAGGTGYSTSDVLTAIGGTFSAPVKITLTDVIGGAVIGFSVTDSGSYSTVPPNPVSFSGGGGSGFKLNIFWVGGVGGMNFTNFTFFFLNGKQHQSYLPGFDAEDDTFTVGLNLIAATPWVQAFTDPDLDEIRVAIGFPQLENQDASTGSITGTSVELRFEIQSNGGGFVTVLDDTVTGKASGPYVKNYSFPLAGLDPPWDVRVTRVTPDSTSSLLHNATTIDAFTLVVYGKLSHPNTALAGTIIDAKQFPNIPTRAFLLKGLIVNVPTNYDPDTRTYATDGPGTTAGTWDGTFKLAWTDNPAWCFLDMCTNERYGLGKFLAQDQVSKFDLYAIAQYCDEPVPNGFGGFEPRFAISLYLQQQEDAMKVISDMASIFRGLVYFSQGTLVPTQDKPTDSSALFSPANVINGQFIYSGTSKRARHTVAHVMYNDMTDLGRLKPAVFEDPEQILKYGYNPLKMTAFGCNSLGQALRLGKWAIRVEKALTDTVSFSTGQEGFFVRPGMVVQILDPFRYRADFSGRLSAVTMTQLNLDRKVTLVAGEDYFVSFVRPSDSMPITVAVTNVPGSGTALVDFLTVGAMAEPPEVGTIWQLAFAVKKPETYRVIAVSARDDATADITALLYDASIYVRLDDDPPGDPPSTAPPPKQLDVPRYVAAPQDLVFSEYVVDHEVGPQRVLQVTWTASDDPFRRGYLVKFRYEKGNWVFLDETPVAHVLIPMAAPGTYEVKAMAVNFRGYQSASADGTYTGMVGGPVAADMAGGDYTGNVVLTSEVPSAVIYYTTDGSDPTDEANMGRSVYSAPVAVAPPLTLKASAKRRGRYTDVAEFDYSTTACGLPTFSPVPDPHFPLTDPVSLALATTTAGADIYYTDDGSTPDNTKTLYSAPFALDIGSTIIKAIAIKAGLSDSPVATGHFHVRAAD